MKDASIMQCILIGRGERHGWNGLEKRVRGRLGKVRPGSGDLG